VDIKFEVRRAHRGGGTERFEGVFGMSAGAAAMPECSRERKFEEVGVEVIGHLTVLF
jgi:hypothetical protein